MNFYLVRMIVKKSQILHLMWMIFWIFGGILYFFPHQSRLSNRCRIQVIFKLKSKFQITKYKLFTLRKKCTEIEQTKLGFFFHVKKGRYMQQ